MTWGWSWASNTNYKNGQHNCQPSTVTTTPTPGSQAEWRGSWPWEGSHEECLAVRGPIACACVCVGGAACVLLGPLHHHHHKLSKRDFKNPPTSAKSQWWGTLQNTWPALLKTVSQKHQMDHKDKKLLRNCHSPGKPKET